LRLRSPPSASVSRALLADNGAERQRYVARRQGLDGVTRWLAEGTVASARE
jgi:hypothetical protein